MVPSGRAAVAEEALFSALPASSEAMQGKKGLAERGGRPAGQGGETNQQRGKVIDEDRDARSGRETGLKNSLGAFQRLAGGAEPGA